MRILLAVFSAILLTGCTLSEPKPKADPQWYANQTLPIINRYDVIGYGRGSTIKEAEANAKEDIAQSLMSKVDSTFVSVATDDSAAHESQLKITSTLDLQNVQTIKQEQRDGTFFVALIFENLDLAYRVKTTIGDVKCSRENVNTYMKQTSLFKKISASVGCALDLKLDRRNGAWYLKYKEYLFLLNDDEYEELYITVPNDNFEFISSKNIFKNGDSFYFTFNVKEEGYNNPHQCV